MAVTLRTIMDHVSVVGGNGDKAEKFVVEVRDEESGTEATITLKDNVLEAATVVPGNGPWTHQLATEAVIAIVTALAALGKTPAAPEAVGPDAETVALWEKLDQSVYAMGLSSRSDEGLRHATIRFIGDLVQRSESELLDIRKNSRQLFGPKQLKDCKEVLAKMGLHLDMTREELKGWVPPTERNKGVSSGDEM